MPGDEITPAEDREARADGLLVIFGYSDDLCELCGAIHNEVSAWQGAEIFINGDGKLLVPPDADETEVLSKFGVLTEVTEARKQATKVTALFSAEPQYTWTYETTAPHATFDIAEDGERYCRGLVIDLKEI